MYFIVRNSNLSLLILLKVHGPYCNWRENYSTNQSRPRTTFSHRCWILLRPGAVPCTDHGWEFIADTTCANICLNSLKVVFNLLLLCSILSWCQLSRYGFWISPHLLFWYVARNLKRYSMILFKLEGSHNRKWRNWLRSRWSSWR